MSETESSTFIGRQRKGLRRVVMIAAAGGFVITLLAWFGRWSWSLDLLSHFCVQLAIGMLLLSVLLLVMRCRWWATLCFATMLLNLAPVAHLFFGPQRAEDGNGPTLRLMLANVNSQTGDPDLMGAQVVRESPDFLVLVEVSDRWNGLLARLSQTYPYHCIRLRTDNFGIALFSKLPLLDKQVVNVGDASVPTIVALTDTGSAALRIIATHPLPPCGPEYSRLRNDQLAQLPGLVTTNQPTLLTGDLNTTPWNAFFKKLVADSGLIDSTLGFGIQPTWPSHNPLLSVPLDHCLVSSDIVVRDRRRGDACGSDHMPVIIDFEIPVVPPELPRAVSAGSACEATTAQRLASAKRVSESLN